MIGKYRVVGRYMSGVRVLGYYLTDVNLGTGFNATKEEVEQMALNKQLVNCTAQHYQDKILLKGVGMQLNKLPVVDVSKTQTIGAGTPEGEPLKASYTILARLIHQKHVVGYVVIDERGKQHRISREKTMQLALDGLVNNARVQKYREQLVLRGVNCELSSLPGFRMSMVPNNGAVKSDDKQVVKKG